MQQLKLDLKDHSQGRKIFKPAPLSKAEDEIFKKMQWHAVAFVGSIDEVARRVGDEAGIWPIAPWLSADWVDKLTATVDRASPVFAQGLLLRLWFENKADVKRFQFELPAFFADKATTLRGGWFGLSCNRDLLSLQIELMEFAERCGLPCFDDETALQRLRAGSAN